MSASGTEWDAAHEIHCAASAQDYLYAGMSQDAARSAGDSPLESAQAEYIRIANALMRHQTVAGRIRAAIRGRAIDKRVAQQERDRDAKKMARLADGKTLIQLHDELEALGVAMVGDPSPEVKIDMGDREIRAEMRTGSRRDHNHQALLKYLPSMGGWVVLEIKIHELDSNTGNQDGYMR